MCEHTFDMRRSDEEFAVVKELHGDELSIREISRRTGIPRATVQSWVSRRDRQRRSLPPDPNWRPLDDEQYCYVLGVYSGDGHIVQVGRSACIRVTLDARYPGIVREVLTR